MTLTADQIWAKQLAETTLNKAIRRLLEARSGRPFWEGELSTSALSTATAIMALQIASRTGCDKLDESRISRLIDGGLRWLAQHQNKDGGWGDTVLSVSNISTTMLANAVFHACGERVPSEIAIQPVLDRSQKYLDAAGGVEGVIKRYGKDHTFSVPILTHCALAGIVDWNRVMPLPFELACVPAKWYAAVRMPVVSYALPALIAIGQVIFEKRGHWNPIVRWIRKRAKAPAMRILESIQPENGGFLEATPLTSFVCMSLLECGYTNHVVTERCLKFIEASVRSDGSWPIDTNLTTWVTTLSINALAGQRGGDGVAEHLSVPERDALREWLLKQQYRDIHPYTNSPPGGWAWTDLPGGVPDADDTPGAMLAVMNLRRTGESFSEEERDGLAAGVEWLLGLQNRDGGWPTFCRGWGTLPFDRSSNDLTAHVMRALTQYVDHIQPVGRQHSVIARAVSKGEQFLIEKQRSDGSWLPLWFGNQHNENDENPLYGSAKVVVALRETNRGNSACCRDGIRWLLNNQNDEGSWSGRAGLPGSVEETALAVEALSGLPEAESSLKNAVDWLSDRVDDGTFADPAPIGFYFAKLWYFEQLYPIIFTVAALQRYAHRSQTQQTESEN